MAVLVFDGIVLLKGFIKENAQLVSKFEKAGLSAKWSPLTCRGVKIDKNEHGIEIWAKYQATLIYVQY